MLVDETNLEIFEKVEKETITKYNIKWFKAEEIKGYIAPEEMLIMIEDLLYEIGYWKEKYEDLTRDVENNYEYKPQPDPDCER